MKKKKVLFIADGIALAHAIRSQQLESYLDTEKYELYLAVADEFSHLITLEHVKYIPLKSLTVQEYRKRLNDITCKHVYDTEVISIYLKSDEELIDLVKPDVVVGDIRVTLGIVCRKRQIPFINIQNAYYSPNTQIKPAVPDVNPIRYMNKKLIDNVFEEKFKEVNDNFILAYNEEAVRAGLREVKDMNELYSNGDLNLFLDTPTLSPVNKLAENQVYVGPVLTFPNQNLPEWWGNICRDRPVIYCSIGSTGSSDKVRRIVDILGKMNVSVIFVTAGYQFIKKYPQNFYVCKYLSALDGIAISDMVIFNGGSGTLYQALSLGKPIVALATLSDQFFACSEVEKLGVGRVFRYRQMKKRVILDEIDYLLNDLTVKKNCAEIQQEIMNYNSKKKFPEYFDNFVEQF